MAGESASARENLEQAVAELEQLRQFAGAAAEFWPRFLSVLQRLTSADQFTVLGRRPDEPFRRIIDWPKATGPSLLLARFLAQSAEFAARTVQAAGAITVPLDPKEGAAARSFVIGVRLRLSPNEDCALLGVISEVNEAKARESALRLALSADAAEAYQRNLAAAQGRAEIEKLAAVLDLALSMGGERKFLHSALTFCNGLATRFQCDRVSLGWLDRGWVRLQAISRTEHFDRQMAAAQALETAMEEALDQDDEIVWPAPAGATVIARDHRRFAEEQKARHLCSLPLRRQQEPIAVVTCERQAAPFTDAELQQLRLSCDLASPRLAVARETERWFGARWAGQVRAQAAKLLGPEHTWAKIVAALIVIGLGLLVFLRVPYRVEGNFVLRSDQLAYVAAPFDGFIDEAGVRPGDRVQRGDLLLKLKTDELELEESYALADLARYQREAEKARSGKQLAEMRIAEAMAHQAAARLELVRHRIAQAALRSPFAGVVIEGDLRDRLGYPVKSADVLVKVAQIETLYVEAEVNEREVHEILGREVAEIAFVAQPKHTFAVRIVAVEQAAVTKPDGNVFLVRCTFERGVEPWWRPGMSGVCKIPAGRRTLLWVLTHRTVDFLRMKLWW